MFRSWPTLLAALLLGAALGMAGSGEKNPAPPGDPPAAADAFRAAGNRPASPSLDPGKSKPGRDGEAASSSAYSAAWDLLKDGRLPRSERLPLQQALLDEWSFVDLKAALRANFAEDDTGNEDPFAPNLSGACRAGIDSQPDLAWELIESREFGLHTRSLRAEWIQVMARQRPLGLIEGLSGLPKDQRNDAIRTAIVETHRRDKNRPGKEEVVAAVLALRGTPDEADALDAYAGGLALAVPVEDLRAEVLHPSDPGLRPLHLDAYVRSFFQFDPAKLEQELSTLPAVLRTEVAEAWEVRRAK